MSAPVADYTEVVPILIVGGGPTGLSLSALLSLYGVESLLVEADAGTCDHPQAHVINARTCEIMRSLGCDEEIHARADLSFGSDVCFMTAIAGETLATFSPVADKARVRARRLMSPCVPLSCPQDLVEPVLAHKAGEGPGKIWYSARLVEVLQDDAGVTATIMHDGRELQVRSDWLVACDGAGSPTRKLLEIPMEGPDVMARVVGIYFHADLSKWLADKPAMLYWTIDDVIPATVINLGHNRWAAHVGWDADNQPLETFTDARCTEIVRRIVGAEVAAEIRSARPWVMTAQIAAAYSKGRAYLAGDAAHRFPPTGGFGLNTGVQDAHNLAWKLALVLHGIAGEGLLKTYEVERKPVAAANSDFSVRNARGMASVMGPGALALGRRLAAGEVSLAEVSLQIQTLLEAEAGHFDPPGRELGYVYTGPAVIGDGTSPPEVADADRDYVQSACPGARAPHMWIEVDGRKCSTIDLFSEHFTLLVAAAQADAWRKAAQTMEAPVVVLGIGSDIQCDMSTWQSLYAADIVLVRPDGHVAWRASAVPADTDAGALLSSTVTRLLGN